MEYSKFRMSISAPSRHLAEKMADILSYRDPDFFLHRLCPLRISPIREESGKFVFDAEGVVECSCNMLFSPATPYDNECNPPGNAQMTTFPQLGKLAGIEVVCDAVNDTRGFSEHYEVDASGLRDRKIVLWQ